MLTAGMAAPDHLPSTDTEELLAANLDATSLMMWLLSIINEGRRTATYKPALLMAIIDISFEAQADRGNELFISIDDLAHRVVAQYWPQTRVSPLASSGVLKQAADKSRIVDALVELREQTKCPFHSDIASVRVTHPREYSRAHRKVAAALVKQPIPRLQRPGASSTRDGYEPRLYDDSGFVAERGAAPGVEGVTLKAGVASLLAQNSQLLRPAIELVWCREVVRYNQLNSEEEELRAFMFGVERRGLATARDALLDLEGPRCFWCGTHLKSSTPHVDHVIPWSAYPLNDLGNLVLADAKCNGDKSARLVDHGNIGRWVQRDRPAIDAAATTIAWPNDADRTHRVATSAYHWLPTGMPVWRGIKDVITFSDAERARVLDELARAR